MPDIVLSTLNARFIHASFGLRYLMANLGELRSRAVLAEFEIQQPPLEIVEAILAHEPRIVALGVYIWNARQSLEVVSLLKRLRPGLTVVLGGPEVSHEWDQQPLVDLADHTITGEADLAFAEVCRVLLPDPEPAGAPGPRPGAGEGAEAGADRAARLPKVIPASLPDLKAVKLPYDLYSEADLAHRVVYVEASRGCPFSCEFCLSSLDVPVRQFPLEGFLAAMKSLLDRGACQFKFVDRTFNLNLEISRAILRLFREHWRDGLFLHFEMIPDRLPEALREEIAWFPRGALQFEIGIQSLNPEVCARIHRRQNVERTGDNFRFLREHTGVHIHADLIAGLPGETLESFADGFDRLVQWRPQEIQFGILKRLRGTPITRHDSEWGMRYNPLPPYDILENRLLDFATFQRLRRFARYWDLVANSGRFIATTPLIWADHPSPFWSFLAFSDWLHAGIRQTHAIALDRLAHRLFDWLVEVRGLDRDRVVEALSRDWRASGQRDLPEWLTATTNTHPTTVARGTDRPGRRPRPTAARQARHLQTGPQAD